MWRRKRGVVDYVPAVPDHCRYWSVPYWVVVGVGAVLPAARICRRVRGTHVRALALCPSCGQEFRGTPEKCPECGH